MNTKFNPNKIVDVINAAYQLQQQLDALVVQMNNKVNQGPLKGLIEFSIVPTGLQAVRMKCERETSFRAQNRLKAYNGYFEALAKENNQMLAKLFQ